MAWVDILRKNPHFNDKFHFQNSLYFLNIYFRRGGEIGETDDDTQSGSATDVIGTSEVI